MAATDGQITVAAARWSDEGRYIREFFKKNTAPAVVKIIKGQYSGIGVPALPNPGLQSIVMVVSLGKRQKILAQPVKIKEGRRLSCVGPRIVIPESYMGYFELLSEEGRAVRCMESVTELARRKPEEGCLVREPIRAVHAKIEANGCVTPEGARIIHPGEILVPISEVAIPNDRKNRYLKCVDSKGDTLLLGLEQRGKFSAIAREDNISGVHTAKNLLSKRLPITVRLVFGPPPRGLKNASNFVPEIRLLSVFEEEHVFALPLQKETNHVVMLPLAAPLKLLNTKNEDALKQTVGFKRLVEKCTRLANEMADQMQILDGKLGDNRKYISTQPEMIKTNFLLRRSASAESANPKVVKQLIKKDEKNPAVSKNYDEIDQIYDYVRGFAPLPKSKSNNSTPVANKPTITSSHSLTNLKPDPPPIDTIPSRKIQTEKTARTAIIPKINTKTNAKEKIPPGLPKLYIKNQSQRSRILRQKSQSPMNETPPSPVSKSGSPIFNLRYKSLNNLQSPEVDGSLDSSHSGGKYSTDLDFIKKNSSDKKNRKMTRPKSLTNLAWELKEYQQILNSEKLKINKTNAIKKPSKSSVDVFNIRRDTLIL